jgi:hypothetical protein
MKTFIESIISNTRHAVGDGDGDKTSAAIESTIANTRYAIADGKGCKARAIEECFKY